MKVIGITGGIGSGKSALLSYIEENYNCKVILADLVAHQAMQPTGLCYVPLIELLSAEILDEDQNINHSKMALKIFQNPELRVKVNSIVHPAVKKMIISIMNEEKARNAIDFLFIEAALLIEDGYLNIVDEMWYVYAEESIRRKRLKEARNYLEEKIDSIIATQLTESDFRKHCEVVIDNSGSLSAACEQIDRILGEK